MEGMWHCHCVDGITQYCYNSAVICDKLCSTEISQTNIFVIIHKSTFRAKTLLREVNRHISIVSCLTVESNLCYS